MEIKLATAVSAQEARSLSLSEITRKINAELSHDEASWEADKRIPFRGKRPAEGFERLLYLCPECGQIGTILTHRNRIYCSACGAEYTLDACGLIRAVRGYLPADNAADLNAWQLGRFREYIASHTGDTLIRDECACLSRRRSGGGPEEKVAYGTLILTRSALIIENLCFRLREISGIALHFKSGLMFRRDTEEYLVRFDDPRVSIHKWGCAMEIITGNPVG